MPTGIVRKDRSFYVVEKGSNTTLGSACALVLSTSSSCLHTNLSPCRLHTLCNVFNRPCPRNTFLRPILTINSFPAYHFAARNFHTPIEQLALYRTKTSRSCLISLEPIFIKVLKIAKSTPTHAIIPNAIHRKIPRSKDVV